MMKALDSSPESLALITLNFLLNFDRNYRDKVRSKSKQQRYHFQAKKQVFKGFVHFVF